MKYLCPFSSSKASGLEEVWSTGTIFRYFLNGLVVSLSAAVSGLLGMGSGTNFVLGFLYILKFELLKAVGTGVYIMTILMGIMSVVYLLDRLPYVANNIWWLWRYLLISTVSGLLGTSFGIIFSLKIPQLKMNFIIAFLLIVIGLIAVIEPYVIRDL
eukprot:TRINITY_DN6500_c0_g1_i2.p1 TRINITY_DN6500_c0_g1~~TRINITY_DN6500_c0_g1_i2.p1  ORF type:complete len:157 (+),score=18.84 TRINITY_DN6500_c0_g1_i2:115-585(+)